jgi:uncharacterized protein (TIGR03118 family)
MHSLYPSKNITRRFITLTLALACCLLVAYGLPSSVSVPAVAQTKSDDGEQTPHVSIPVIAPGSAYRQTNFVSDWPGIAPVLDPLLVNPWGISMTGMSPFWVANNGTSTSTLYRGDVGGSPLVKNAGLAGITIPGNLPTGTVANIGGPTDFVVSSGPASARANFLFSSITGNISGWSPNVPAPGSTTAVIMASQPTRVYTGLAIANNGGAHLLYAPDFKNGNIDVYNSTFALTTVPGGFIDPSVPSNFHPFNIQAITIGGVTWLYVAYAKVSPNPLPEDGVGNGYVRRFDTNGAVDGGFAINNGPLNSPWGLAVSPAGTFGLFSDALLVGNFGNGNPSIHAFDKTSGGFLGTFQNEAGVGIVINRLWALNFGNGGAGGDPNTLYFTAGIGEEEHGLFGSLKQTTATATSLIQFSTSAVSIGEGSGHIDITVIRDGDTSGPATINYTTFDQTRPGHASQRSDYELALGKLTFAPGETSKTFRILLIDDLFVETGGEVVDLVLSNPTGAGVGLGSPNMIELTITDNDVAAPTTNPIDEAQFFVRQQHLDLFNREPDAAGLAFWADQITSCGSDAKCIYRKRIDVSAAFFLSIEFQQTGFLDILTHQAAFGRKPLYGEFQLGTQALKSGVFFGQPGADAQLEANKQAYFNEFVTRPEFVGRYPSSQTNTEFVNALLTSAGLLPTQVRLFVVNLTNAQENPPANPTSSGGGARPASFGTARLQFNAAQTAMTFTSTVTNIDFTGSQTPGEANDNLTVAHIHAGPAVTAATNGPVVWGFFGTPFNDNNPNDQVVTPFTTGVGGSISGKWDAPEGNNTTLAAQLSNLREGRAYVNFHTTQFPGGEIRGNIPAATAFRDSLIAGLNGGTETRATVLRKVAEQEELRLRESNAAYALLGFFGYFREDPGPATPSLNLLLDRLNTFNGDINQAGLVRIFITASEYRQRFGNDPVPLSNTAPVAADDTALTSSIRPVIINVLANDTDFENEGFLVVTSVMPGTGGTPSIVGNSVRFTPSPGFTGTATFQYTITDNGTSNFTNTTLNDPKTSTATVTVTVIEPNHAPVNTVPGAQTTNQDAPLVFSAGNGNAISVADIDAPVTPVQVILTAANGTLTLSTTAGLSFIAGDGTADQTMTFTGTIAAVNAALNGLTFQPTPGYTGPAGLTITTNDLAFTSIDGALSDTDSVAITVLPSSLQLSASSYNAGEADGRATITVTRTGGAASSSRIDYVTTDLAGLDNCNVNTGNASARCDYTAVGGTLSFLPGETTKTFTVPIIDDVYVEGLEVLTVTLSNVSGAVLGAQTSATLTINDNDIAPGAANPIDQRPFLVRQFYLDMLNREPDPAGLAAWLNRLNTCPLPGETLVNCDEIEVASAFFRSPEFFDRAYFIYKFYEAALGRQPQYDEYQRDLRRLTGFLTAEELEQRKREFAEEFVNRAEFRALYDSFGSGQPFVDAVLATAGTARPGVGAAVVTTSNRQSVINRLGANQITRGQGLRELMEAPEISQRFFNKAFVVIGYFSFLRRNPDAAYLHWINVLNTTGDYRAMIRGFLLSPEYRSRFGQP